MGTWCPCRPVTWFTSKCTSDRFLTAACHYCCHSSIFISANNLLKTNRSETYSQEPNEKYRERQNFWLKLQSKPRDDLYIFTFSSHNYHCPSLFTISGTGSSTQTFMGRWRHPDIYIILPFPPQEKSITQINSRQRCSTAHMEVDLQYDTEQVN